MGRPSAWRVARLPVHACGTYVGTTVIGPPFGVRCYSADENAVGIVGPPRTVKTMLMTWQVADVVGRSPVLSLQTKASTYHDTWPLAMARGVRVHLIDPEGQTGHPSTFRWAPQSGCADPDRAASRAAALVTACVKVGKDDGEIIQRQAGDLLRFLLWLTATARRDARQLHDWAQGPANAGRAVKFARDNYLDAVPGGWVKSAEAVLDSGATRTTGAVFYALREAVGYMEDEAVAQLCTPGPFEPAFDVGSFLAGREAVYLIATDRPNRRVGPLLSAFAAHVIEEAMRIAGPRTADRSLLEPFLLVSNDEAANTIPLDLPRLCADSGGRGITIVWSAQSRSQLKERFGEPGAQTVWNSTTTKLQGSGSTVADDLRDLSDLSGKRPPRQGRRPGERDAERDREAVMSLADGRLIPRGCAALVHGDMPVTIVRIRKPWTRPDVALAKLRAAGRTPTPLPAVITPEDGVA